MKTKTRKPTQRSAHLDSRYAEYGESVLRSHQRLLEKGILPKGSQANAGTNAGELSISVRVPGETALAIGVFAPDGTVNMHVVDFDARQLAGAELPVSASMARRQIELHAQTYAARPDVGAIVWNEPLWGGALARLGRPMPGIFDEQARQMGKQVAELHSETQAGDRHVWNRASLRLLATGANVFLYQGHAICLGMTRERAVFNAELLEKCAKAFVLAVATGEPIRRIPWFVRFIANGRLLKDERRSAEAYAKGEIPTGFTAY